MRAKLTVVFAFVASVLWLLQYTLTFGNFGRSGCSQKGLETAFGS